MKKVLLLLMTFFALSTNAQYTKNIKKYITKSGVLILPGMKIKVLKGNNETIEGQHLWSFYGRKKMPVPDEHFSIKNEGKEYTIEKVLKLKGLKNPEQSTIVFFLDGKRKCYSFIVQALLTNEVEIIKNKE